MEDQIVADLQRSDLTAEDMSIRQLSSPERAATNTPYSAHGYVIPYYNLYGKFVPFYRVRLFDHDPKYKQPKESSNHVYFPKSFLKLADTHDYIILTEGEKKAALMCKRGFPTIALGGVDSWRNKILTIPAESDLKANDQKMTIKLPAQSEPTEDNLSSLAIGIQDIIDYILVGKKTLIICYDYDHERATNGAVQRAAASLGFELRFRGLAFDKIRQIHLPQPSSKNFLEKVGLDDYVLNASEGSMEKLIQQCLAKRSAFPRHPNIRDYLNKKLQKPKMSRKEVQAVSLAILSELDAGGIRLRSSVEAQSYYFDAGMHKLMKVTLTGQPGELAENHFGQHLYRSFGLGAADQKVLQWVGTHFTGEDPVDDVTPFRVFARKSFKDDKVIMQLSDGEYAVVDKNGLTIKNNGTDNVLFESDQVKQVDIEKLKKEFAEQSQKTVRNWWMEVLTDVRLRDKDKQRTITALLFYLSPWLYRWRGTQLPIEMTLGEAGSGKSTLQELRLAIQTGDPKLRNSPQDLKDWTASISNSGGLHITDNVQLLDKNLRQRLSDEICRLITEAEPTVEMRKYYTNADLVRLPVKCVFGITAISQPFLNSDILQRSIIIELDKAQDIKDGSLSYDMAWKDQQLARYGGREAWLAHHFLVLQKFFQLIERKWSMKYQAKHRLINFEQSLVLLAEVFGIDGKWIPGYLTGATDMAVADADWAIQGLRAFAEFWILDPRRATTPFTVQDIGNWATGMEEYDKCEMLINTRKLGKYIKTHKSMVMSVARIYENGTRNNRATYSVKA